MHGLGAEDGLHQRSAGAQSDPTWGHVLEGGAGGEQEELPEESCPPGGSGRVTEGEDGEAGFTVNTLRSDDSEWWSSDTKSCVVSQEELSVMRCQVVQLYSNRQRPQQDTKSSTSKPKERYKHNNQI